MHIQLNVFSRKVDKITHISTIWVLKLKKKQAKIYLLKSGFLDESHHIAHRERESWKWCLDSYKVYFSYSMHSAGRLWQPIVHYDIFSSLYDLLFTQGRWTMCCLNRQPSGKPICQPALESSLWFSLLQNIFSEACIFDFQKRLWARVIENQDFQRRLCARLC